MKKKMGRLKDKTSLLALVRHGESTWNAQGLWTGWTDVSLSEKGKKEARLAATLLKGTHFDLAITSDLKRATETLEIIKKALGCPDLPTIIDVLTRERSYGEYTGKNKWEIKELLGEEKFKRLRRGWDEPIPKGETLKDVYQRVLKSFRKNFLPAIAQGKNILFVSHGNTLRALVKYLDNLSDEAISEVEIATGEVILYQLNPKGEVIAKKKLFSNKERRKQ